MESFHPDFIFNKHAADARCIGMHMVVAVAADMI